jgi:hypothetical protein
MFFSSESKSSNRVWTGQEFAAKRKTYTYKLYKKLDKANKASEQRKQINMYIGTIKISEV